jgi:hypothetical protein
MLDWFKNIQVFDNLTGKLSKKQQQPRHGRTFASKNPTRLSARPAMLLFFVSKLIY